MLRSGHDWRKEICRSGVELERICREGRVGWVEAGETATAWGLGEAEMVFILSPPPACKESFILNPFPLLTPPELALCWNGLILKRDK